jgi:hypothetical protein
MNTNTNSTKGSKGSKGKGRISESRAETVLDNSDLPTPAKSVTGDVDAMLARFSGPMQSNIEALKLVPNGKGEHCATQWARLRSTLNAAWAGAVVTLRDAGVLSDANITGAVDSLRDAQGKGAPIYGAQKLIDTIAMLSSRKGLHVSKLHSAYCTALVAKGSIDNASMCKQIETRAVCAPSTSATQRSSSAYALRALGIIEETREGATLTQTPAANVLREVFETK